MLSEIQRRQSAVLNSTEHDEWLTQGIDPLVMEAM